MFKAVDKALEYQFAKIERQLDGPALLVRSDKNVVDELVTDLKLVESNPWNLNIISEEKKKLLKRRGMLQVDILISHRIARGVHWVKPLPAVSDLGIENPGTVATKCNISATHKARYYQNYNKYFRETRDIEKCVQDLDKLIGKIEQYVGKMKEEEFKTNEVVIDAVLCNLIIIGEVAGILQVKRVVF